MKKTLRKAIETIAHAKLIDTRYLHRAVESEYFRKMFHNFDFDLVLDVGANEGQFFQRLRRGGYQGKVISFEPIPLLFETLLLKSKTDPNWTIDSRAVSTETKDGVNFNIMDSSQMSSLHQPRRSGIPNVDRMNSVANKISVSTVSIHQVIKEHCCTTNNLLKLDTQGHDLEILRACGPAIREISAIMSELSFQNIYASSNDWIQLIELLSQEGFILSAMFQNNAGHFPHLLECDAIFVRRDLLR
jgi:FkbM family methyltransferase